PPRDSSNTTRRPPARAGEGLRRPHDRGRLRESRERRAPRLVLRLRRRRRARVAKIGFGSGAAGKGTASVAGKNDAKKGLTHLPTGVVAALSGQTHPTIQLPTSNGFCVGATLTEVTKDDGPQYKARKK